jgi:uncharacterized protein (DUF362 family)
MTAKPAINASRSNGSNQGDDKLNYRTDVGVFQDREVIRYPDKAPFSPAILYPEYPFPTNTRALNLADGQVYHLVRRLFVLMKLDYEHCETPVWNPLGHLIQSGDTVLIKPNLVRDYHGAGGDVFSVITHGSIIRAVMDYVWIALGGQGTIVVGDAPVQGANFEAIIQRNGLDKIMEFYNAQGIKVVLQDFRQSFTELTHDRMVASRRQLAGDGSGYAVIGFDQRSWLAPLKSSHKRFRVTQYDALEMRKHHNELTHEYLVSKSVLQADVVINLPKMKTHRKVGITAAMKNLVGINGSKDWLPHHRFGSVVEGGDEFLNRNPIKSLRSKFLDFENHTQNISLRRLSHYAVRVLGRIAKPLQQDLFLEGSWYGNDTAWRMVLDLNRVLLFASKAGVLLDKPQRRVFHLIDGIIAGEGEGPLEPTARPVGILVAGYNSIAVDAVVARLMGFDYRKIPMILNAFSDPEFILAGFEPEDIRVISNLSQWNALNLTAMGTNSLNFEPASGWKGFIELSR